MPNTGTTVCTYEHFISTRKKRECFCFACSLCSSLLVTCTHLTAELDSLNACTLWQVVLPSCFPTIAIYKKCDTFHNKKSLKIARSPMRNVHFGNMHSRNCLGIQYALIYIERNLPDFFRKKSGTIRAIFNPFHQWCLVDIYSCNKHLLCLAMFRYCCYVGCPVRFGTKNILVASDMYITNMLAHNLLIMQLPSVMHDDQQDMSENVPVTECIYIYILSGVGAIRNY